MKERPILFNGDMVRAILEGSKSQTRRVVSHNNSYFNGGKWAKHHRQQTWDWEAAFVDRGPSPAGNPGPYLKLPWKDGDTADFEGTVHRIYPKWQPGDRLWVREKFKPVVSGQVRDGYGEVRYGWAYEADGAVDWSPGTTKIYDLTNQPPTGPMQFRNTSWKPSIHMPRRASRIILEITGVGVERLQEISEEDAKAEGAEARLCTGYPYANPPSTYVNGFCQIWKSINGPGFWDANPWVWCIEFRRITQGDTP